MAGMENAPRCTWTTRPPWANPMTERRIPSGMPSFVVEPAWEIEYNASTNRFGLGMPHHIALEMLAHADVDNVDLADVPASRGGP